MTSKRKLCVCALGALMYALFYALGSEMEATGVCAQPETLKRALLLWPLFLLALGAALRLASRPRKAVTPPRPFSAHKAFAFIVLCYLPMFAIMYPGNFCYDTPYQMAQFALGEYNTHHPLLHTLFFKFCLDMTPHVGTLNRAAALYTVLQTLLLAGCFALACASIARFAGPRAARLSAVFFGLYPMHMIYAVTMTKDVLFSGAFAWFLALCVRALSEDAPGRAWAVQLVVSGALCVLLRNNMLFALGAWLLFAGLFLLKRKPHLVACAAAALLAGCLVNAGLAAATHAEPGDPKEMLSWPIQQVARVRVMSPDRLNARELAALDKLFPNRRWDAYHPMSSDPIKWLFNTRELKRHLGDYIQIYASIGRKYPSVYLDAVISLSYPYFYPYPSYRGIPDYIEIGIKSECFDQYYGAGRVVANARFASVRKWLLERVCRTGADGIPVLEQLLNAGLIAWAMLFFVLREAYAGRWKRFAVSLLPVLLWGTYLMGPLMCSRYVYPFVCAMPALATRERS